MQAIARAPGSCGELIQGTVSGINFLVTCPVGLYSQVKVTLTENKIIKVSGEGSDKVKYAVQLAFELMGIEDKGAEVIINSEIPRGKGMASSTADIAAAVAATAKAAGEVITPGQIAGIALQIEPSDGIMFPGITLFDHVRGRIKEYIGPAPDMELIIIDLGGQIDTVEFNKRQELNELNRDNEPEIKKAITLLKKGFKEANWGMIGKAATISALANQKIIYKNELTAILAVGKNYGALGVNVAHSGTVAGLLFASGQIPPKIKKELKKIIQKNGEIYETKLINGGIEVLIEERGEPFWQEYSISTGETYGKPQINMV